MHFTFQVTLGNLLTVAALLGFAWRLERFINLMLVEHDMMMVDYAKQHGFDLDTLPTRRRISKLL